MVTRAREMQAENFADEIVDISDNSTNDWVDREVGSGRTTRVLDHEHVQRSRLRTDVRLKLMEKFAPDRYGPRSQVNVLSSKEAEFERLDALTDEQRLQEAKELIAEARRRLALAKWTGELDGAPVTDVEPDDTSDSDREPPGGIGK